MESRQSLRSIAQTLRCVAQDIEAVAVEGVATSDAPSASKPKQHPWEELRDISALLWGLGVRHFDDEVQKRLAIHHLDEIADSLEDMYEHSRDH